MFVHRQDQIAEKNSVCLAKYFTRANRILHRHVCGANDKFHICVEVQWGGVWDTGSQDPNFLQLWLFAEEGSEKEFDTYF